MVEIREMKSEFKGKKPSLHATITIQKNQYGHNQSLELEKKKQKKKNQTFQYSQRELKKKRQGAVLS